MGNEKGVRFRSDEYSKGKAKAITVRKIKSKTCEFWDYRTGEDQNGFFHVAAFRDRVGGKIAWCKIRRKDKKFYAQGDTNYDLYGSWLFNDGGKMITIVEGEIDAMTVWQENGNWPVVSLPHGISSLSKSLSENFEYLNKFDKIVLFVDNDEVGRTAINTIKDPFPFGKVHVAWPIGKDANEMLLEGKAHDIKNQIYKAKPLTVDGVMLSSDVWSDMYENSNTGFVKFPFDGLNRLTGGWRRGQIIILAGDTGIGKTNITNEIIFSILNDGEKVGLFAVEESISMTCINLLAILAGVDRAKLLDTFDSDKVSFESRYRDIWVEGFKNLYLYRSSGKVTIEDVAHKVSYMSSVIGCKWIIIDNLTALSGILSDKEDDKQKIDKSVLMIQSVAKIYGIGVLVVMHLNRESEKSKIVSLAHFRGSSTPASICDLALSICLSDKENTDNRSVNLSVLKNRVAGTVGFACKIVKDISTGRLKQHQQNSPLKINGQSEESAGKINGQVNGMNDDYVDTTNTTGWRNYDEYE